MQVQKPQDDPGKASFGNLLCASVHELCKKRSRHVVLTQWADGLELAQHAHADELVISAGQLMKDQLDKGRTERGRCHASPMPQQLPA